MIRFSAVALKGTLLAASLLAVGVTGSALPITGNLGFSGTRLVSFTLPGGPGGISYIDFQDPVGPPNGIMDSDGTTGDFAVTPGLIVPNNDPGWIKDLASAPGGIPGYSVAPVDTLVSIDDFLKFTSLPTTNIRLLMLPSATNCGGGVTCIGAFQLVQNGGNVSVSINILGEILNGIDISAFSGQITAQFLSTNVGDVIAGALSPGGVRADSWSGAIVASAIPEPGTVTMLGIGMMAMAVGALRRRNKSRSN